MFNVTIIKFKDIIRIGIILILIYVFSIFIFRNTSIKSKLSKSINLDFSKYIKMAINSESTIIKKVTKENIKQTEGIELKNLSSISFLKIANNSFKIEEFTNNIGQDVKPIAEENQSLSVEIPNNNISEDISLSEKTQIITLNPINETYNQIYNGVKIRNETSFELTDEILNFDSIEINKNNILIFHTHTCESYTETENNQYIPSR